MENERNINVNYSVIDSAVLKLNQNLQDINIQQDLGKLNYYFNISVGDSSDQLIETAHVVKETYQIVWNLMEQSKQILLLAKRIYNNVDDNIAELIDN